MRDKKLNIKLIVAILFVVMFLGNYMQYQLSPLAPRLMETMGLTPGQFSSVFSAPMIPAILLGIIAGAISDKIGVKIVTSFGLIVMSIGLVARISAGAYSTMLVTMIGAGIGVALINVNQAKIVGNLFPRDKVSTILGITFAGSALGMIVGNATTSMLGSVRTVFILTAVLAVIVTVCWILFLKDGKQKGNAEAEQQISLGESLKAAAKSKNVWIVGICLMCIMGCNVAIASFLPTALQSRGIAESKSGILASVMNVGNLIGSFIGPVMIVKAKKTRMALSGIGIITAVCVIFGWKLPVVPLAIVLLIIGFCMGVFIPVFLSMPVLMPEIGPVYAGSAGGIVSTLELLGAGLIPTYIITPIAGQNFTTYFTIAGGVMLVMVVAVMLLPPTMDK